MIVRKRGDWLAARVGEEILMMSAEEGLYIGLTPVAARIWELIETPLSLAEICARLEAEYEVAPERCRQEVTAFLGELAGRRAVDLDFEA